MKKKRVIVLSDTHCGHKTGLLTPDKYRRDSKEQQDKIAIELSETFRNMVEPLKPFDICIANGDLIDGRENSTELREGDRNRQADIASDCLKQTEARKYVIIKGTPYHVGRNEKFEERIADNLHASSFGAHEYIDINGLIFDCKHKVGSSSIPHGPYTPIAKERLWAVLWSDKGQPDSDIIIRSHTHKFNFCGDFDWLGLTTPGLQGTSEYGATEVQRTIDFGIVYFDVWNKEKWEWHAKQLELELTKSEVIKL